MAYAELKELRERRAKLAEDAKVELSKITDKTSESEAAEIEARFDTMMAEVDSIAPKIARLEKLDGVTRTVNRTLSDPVPGRDGAEDIPDEVRTQEYRDVFEIYAREGRAALDRDQFQVLRSGFQTVENRAQTTAAAAGGYGIPEGFGGTLFTAVADYGGVRPVATVMTTASGNGMPFPTLDDTANKAVLVSEGTQSTATDMTFGSKTLNAYTFRTMATASFELLQDIAIPLESIIGDTFAQRLFLGTNEYFTTGTGSDQPHGIVPASAEGWATTGIGITFDDLIELEHSVKQAHRRNAGYMFHDSTLKAVRKLKDNDGQYLWQASRVLGEPDMLNGRPYTINDDMAEIEALSKSVLFGDMSRYMIRDVSNPLMMRLDERFADSGLVGFIMFSRHDGELMTASATTYNPVKHLVHASA